MAGLARLISNEEYSIDLLIYSLQLALNLKYFCKKKENLINNDGLVKRCDDVIRAAELARPEFAKGYMAAHCCAENKLWMHRMPQHTELLYCRTSAIDNGIDRRLLDWSIIGAAEYLRLYALKYPAAERMGALRQIATGCMRRLRPIGFRPVA